MKNRKLCTLLLTAAMTIGAQAQVTPVSQMEKLDRGVVSVPISSLTGNFVSWRLLGTDDKSVTTFDLLRDGEVIAQDLKVTNYKDAKGTSASSYQVVTKVNGEAVETSAPVAVWGKKYLPLKLQRPEGGIHANFGDDKEAGKGRVKGTNVPYAYYPNDMSVGDVDGDGKYELFLKWESTHAQDNSFNCGYTGNTFIDCYKINTDKDENCDLLWRIDLGKNIRDGAHYTQFMVYDFDGDGRAEMMCKTATGSKDGLGNYVNQAATDATIKGHDNTKDYRNSSGHIISGPEYLTVFDGLTGKAIHTTWYLPGRAGTGKYLPSGKEASTGEGGSELGKVSTFPTGFWGDNYGGRSERFLGAVAYINGADKPACGIFSRGYYTQAYVWAVSFDGTRLHTEWLHASPTATQSQVYTAHFDESATYPKITVDGDVLMRNPVKTAPANTGGVKSTDTSGGIVGSNTLYGNGNHNLSIADVDGDGCDEIIWGAGALNNDGTLLYATGYGHGDAIHVGKMIPDSADLYVFDVHEEKLTSKHGSWDLHNARTGRVIWHGGSADADNGRGMAGDLTGKDGYEFWSSDERTPRSALTGKATNIKNCFVNFRIYWDGSYQDQLFDGSYQYNSNLGSDAVWDQSSYASPKIQKWNGSSFTNIISFYSDTYNNAQTANYTKATPCLQADILGDWREELIMWNKKDSAEVMLFSTWTPTEYAVPTLMHDHVYRMGVAWQNTAYNQPPHLGYYLPDYIEGRLTGIQDAAIISQQQSQQVFDLQGRRLSGLKRGLNIVRQKNGNGTITTKKIITK
ncbi:MAG: rhamnogalacturonan lyase [Prevotella sp.]|nr:rhamnogalacturonan lyase [Prevotella sp.]